MAAEGHSIGIIVLSTDEQYSTGIIKPWLVRGIGSNANTDFHLQDGNGHTVFRNRGQGEVYFLSPKQFDRLTVAGTLGASHWIHIYTH